MTDLHGTLESYGRDVSVKAGCHLIEAGRAVTNLYYIRSGWFKLERGSGIYPVADFRGAGRWLGLDSLVGARPADTAPRHWVHAIALTDAVVCVVPANDTSLLLHLSKHLEAAQLEYLQEQTEAAAVLRELSSEQAVAWFLVQWQEQLPHAVRSFILPMNRLDIGQYLGMNLETVSRALQWLHRERVLQVRYKEITVLDHARLRLYARMEPPT